MKCILGKKIEMTQVFAADGTVVPVTKVQVLPALVIQKKTIEKDGYCAIVVAIDPVKNVKKPQEGVFKKFGTTMYRTVQEFRMDENDSMYAALAEGMIINSSALAVGDDIEVVGTSKGKGNQGIVKRHHFRGGPRSHGHKDQERHSGTVGAKGPAHIFKGTRMAGRMGGISVTLSGLKVVDVEPAHDIVYVSGAIPGARHGLVSITAHGEFTISKPAAEPVAEVATEPAPAADTTAPAQA